MHALSKLSTVPDSQALQAQQPTALPGVHALHALSGPNTAPNPRYCKPNGLSPSQAHALSKPSTLPASLLRHVPAHRLTPPTESVVAYIQKAGCHADSAPQSRDHARQSSTARKQAPTFAFSLQATTARLVSIYCKAQQCPASTAGHTCRLTTLSPNPHIPRRHSARPT